MIPGLECKNLKCSEPGSHTNGDKPLVPTPSVATKQLQPWEWPLLIRATAPDPFPASNACISCLVSAKEIHPDPRVDGDVAFRIKMLLRPEVLEGPDSSSPFYNNGKKQ